MSDIGCQEPAHPSRPALWSALMDEYRRTGRVVGLAALVVVLVAIALLIAGQGVAVGVGALVGLILGAAGGLAFVLWLVRADPSSSFSFRVGGSSGGEPTEEFIREMRDIADVSGVDLGGIRAVRQILATAQTGGLTLELVSMEERVGGLVMTLDALAAPGVRTP